MKSLAFILSLYFFTFFLGFGASSSGEGNRGSNVNPAGLPEGVEAASNQAFLQDALSAGSDSSSQSMLSHLGYRITEDGLPIFGSQLFQGDFQNLSFSGFNPDYQLGIGDVLQVLIWGAMTEELELTVDAKGNVFLPRVGPVSVLGVRNADLSPLINQRLSQVYSDNVDAYANLRSTQTVKVFVSGFVGQPGLYQGFASDSVLYFLDKSGGVDPNRGSYLDISVVRSGEKISSVDLYQFLQKGKLPINQFRDGDVILVGPRSNTLTVAGDVLNPARFEFTGKSVGLSEMLNYARPLSDATSVSIRRVRSGESSVEVHAIDVIASIQLEPGDEVSVATRSVAKNILVAFTGEHEGMSNMVFPIGVKLSEAIEAIRASELSDLGSIQIFRKSVAERQYELIEQSLNTLERRVLSSSSVSLEEAQLRQVEAETILSFIKRARAVKPTGQIVMEDLADADQLTMVDGDIVYVPRKSRLVTIYGEVKYPNTQTHRDGESLSKYIGRSGGFTDSANEKDIIMIKPNGIVRSVGKGKIDPGPGDEFIILPAPDSKRLLFAKEISTIMYQIALSARVAVGL
jgi:protein involved in polysaccharide export with SLBB domain